MPRLRQKIFSVYTLVILLIYAESVFSQNGVQAGNSFALPATIHNLAVEWEIAGDENLDSRVDVRYRVKGDSVWKEAMPLRRVAAGLRNDDTSRGMFYHVTGEFIWKNKHSGSIFDLRENTEYEILLQLTDPDGGEAQTILNARTRPEPVIPENAEWITIRPGRYDTLFARSGTAERPVVYYCKNGKAEYRHIDLSNKEHVFITGLFVNNLSEEGRAINMKGAENCVVQHCIINAVYGIVAYKPGMTNCTISDNSITGICEWKDEAMGASGKNIGEGIEFTGAANVICYNKVSGFRDNISFMEDVHAVNQVCNDIHNNDLYRALDDAVEADFSLSNNRIYRNRITNAYVALSSQPGLGGPTYFIRNLVYNGIHAAFKLKRFSQGDVILHNTIVKTGTGLGGNNKMDFAFFRNNLAFGGLTHDIRWGGYGAGNPWGADIPDHGLHSSFDYDAVGVYGTPYIARIGGIDFSVVEKNGIGDLKFEETFTDTRFPFPPVPEYPPANLRLKKGSAAIDAGIHIPNINDGFLGKAPDCGAIEFEGPVQHYGPRKK